MHNAIAPFMQAGVANPNLILVGTGDFDGDGTDDILFRDPVSGFLAARFADLMLERGDREGQLVWMQIRRAIGDLQEPPRGAAH